MTFVSLAECQAAIGVARERMNGREMRRLGVSRRQLFETIERPVMQALPEQDYEYAEWHFARVGIDYHVEVAGFLYSVPHQGNRIWNSLDRSSGLPGSDVVDSTTRCVNTTGGDVPWSSLLSAGKAWKIHEPAMLLCTTSMNC